MESAKEKGHWMLIDLDKVKESIDIEKLDNDNLSLFRELLIQYKENLKLQQEYDSRIEKLFNTQKTIIIAFFIGFILQMSFMAYNSPNPFDPVKVIFILIMALTAAFIWTLKPGP